jgi:hypothetical protein
MGSLRSLQGINIHFMNIYTILYTKCNKLLAACCKGKKSPDRDFGVLRAKHNKLPGLFQNKADFERISCIHNLSDTQTITQNQNFETALIE